MVPRQGKADRGAAYRTAYKIRYGNAQGSRNVQRHRKLLTSHHRTAAGLETVYADRLHSGRFPDNNRRVSCDAAPAQGHVRGRPFKETVVGGLRFQAAVGVGQQAA